MRIHCATLLRSAAVHVRSSSHTRPFNRIIKARAFPSSLLLLCQGLIVCGENPN